MSRVSIGMIAGRIVLSISKGEDSMIVEMTADEACKVAIVLEDAIGKVYEGKPMASCFGEFMEGFGA